MTPRKTKNNTGIFCLILLTCSLCPTLRSGEIIIKGNKNENTEEPAPLTNKEIQLYRDKFKKLNTLLAQKKLIEFYLLTDSLLREVIFDSAPDKNKTILSKEERIEFLLLVTNAPLVPFEERAKYIHHMNMFWPISMIDIPSKSNAAAILNFQSGDKTITAPEKIIRANAISHVLKLCKNIVDAGSFENITDETTDKERINFSIKQRDYLAAKNEIFFLEACFFDTLIRNFPGDFEKIKTYFSASGYNEKEFESAFLNAPAIYRTERNKNTEFLFKQFEKAAKAIPIKSNNQK